MIGVLRRSLTVRVYLFALLCVGLVVLSLIALVLSVRIVTMRDRMDYFARSMATLIAEKTAEPTELHTVLEELAHAGMDTALVDANGAVLHAGGEPLPAIGGVLVRRARTFGSLDLGDHVYVAAMPEDAPDGYMALVIRFVPPRPPPTLAAVIIAVLLVVMLAISIVFARSLTRPLGRLSATARRFGNGDLDARTGMTRGDQLGDVSRAFDEMAERITSLIEANRALMGAVSHELRTPMSRIRVTLDLVAEDPEAVHELLAGVSGDLTELERLVDDILTMTRLEVASGMPPLHAESIVPVELAERVRESWQQRHGARALTIAIGDVFNGDVDDEVPIISGDPVLLRRALDNLLDNAAKYAPDDTAVELRVSAETRADEGVSAVCFSVIDRGPGMTPDELAQAFTPFWRSDDSRARNTGGVGLGLPLARQLAHAHGGDIELSSPADGGLCATLRIPCQAIVQKQTETRANDSPHKRA